VSAFKLLLEMDHLVGFGRGGCLINLFGRQQLRQILRRGQEPPLEIEYMLLGRPHGGMDRLMLFGAQTDRTLMLHDELGRKERPEESGVGKVYITPEPWWPWRP
jgi:hypothetical protein